ncbi:MAG: hypothetical protein D6778_02265 [Nitrospirae bacterium]|nr:MAG: hypothetical protein D6778_02265 [Nitrospirota bacterium]
MKIEGLNIGFRTAELKGKVQAQRPEKQAKDLQRQSPAVNEKKALSETKVQPQTYSAYFAVDENNNVVIRIVDSDGKVVRQIPPEEYIRMKEALKETIKNLLNLEA